MPEYPYFPVQTYIHKTPDGHIIFQRREHETRPDRYDINIDGFNIIRRINGNNSTEDIAWKVGLKDKRDFSKINRFISLLSKKVEINSSKSPHNSNLIIFGSANFFTPESVSLELTNKCSFSCDYCYNESSINNDKFLQKPVEILKQLKQIGVQIVEITGGEPSLHPEFLNVLKFATKNFLNVGIITNGFYMSKKVLDTIIKFKDKIFVQINLDASNQIVVDEITGLSGSFQHIIKTIKRLTSKGAMLHVAMVIEKSSQIDDILNTAKLAKELGVLKFGISPVINKGRGKRKILSKRDFNRILEEIEILDKELPDFYTGNMVDRSFLDMNTSHCGAMKRSIAISPRNNIKPCPLSDEIFEIFGRLPDNNLLNLFKSKDFKNIQKLTIPDLISCKKCEFLKYCLGCYVRGIEKAREIGITNCNWLKNEAKDREKAILLEKIIKT